MQLVVKKMVAPLPLLRRRYRQENKRQRAAPRLGAPVARHVMQPERAYSSVHRVGMTFHTLPV